MKHRMPSDPEQYELNFDRDYERTAIAQSSSFESHFDATVSRILPLQVNVPASAELMEMYQELSLHKSLDACAKTFLSQLRRKEPRISRVALFEYRPNGDRLTTLAYDPVERPENFHVIKRLLRSVVAENQSRLLPVPQADKLLVVLPVSGPRSESFIIHAEFDHQASDQILFSQSLIKAYAELAYAHLSMLSLLKNIDHWAVAMAETINAVVEAKDTYTSGHSQRVANFSLCLSQEMGHSREAQRNLYLGAIMHDIGKVGIPDDILKKPGFLTSEEFEEMKAHPMIGSSIIASIPNASELLAPIKYHHEKWDGTGYPEGLSKNEIPVSARVVAVADAFDAMTSGRSYSGYMSGHEAVTSLVEKTDLFDPDVLQALCQAFENGLLSLRTGTVVA